MALQVIDRAIQSFGAEGVSQDTELASLWAGLRTLRIADVRHYRSSRRRTLTANLSILRVLMRYDNFFELESLGENALLTPTLHCHRFTSSKLDSGSSREPRRWRRNLLKRRRGRRHCSRSTTSSCNLVWVCWWISKGILRTALCTFIINTHNPACYLVFSYYLCICSWI